jgi:hypothetical protein
MFAKHRIAMLILSVLMIGWGCYGGYMLFGLLRGVGEWQTFTKPQHLKYETDPLNFTAAIILHLFEIGIGGLGVYRARIYFTEGR